LGLATSADLFPSSFFFFTKLPGGDSFWFKALVDEEGDFEWDLESPGDADTHSFRSDLLPLLSPPAAAAPQPPLSVREALASIPSSFSSDNQPLEIVEILNILRASGVFIDGSINERHLTLVHRSRPTTSLNLFF